MFFQTLQVFERTFTVLGEKHFGRDIKIDNCGLRLKRSIKKPNFWKFWCFFKFFRFLNEHSQCLAKMFSAGKSNLKTAVFVSKVQSKNQTSRSSLFFPILQNFERTFTVFGEKLFGRDIKIEKCSLRLIRSNKKPNFRKIPFFSKSSELWTNIYRACQKVLGRGIKLENFALCLQSINLRIKIIFWKFCKFSFVSDLEHEVFGFVATEISPGLSKLHWLGYMNYLWDVGIRSDITWRQTLFEPWQKNFDLFDKTALYVSKGTLLIRKTTSESSGFFQTLQVFGRTFTVLGEKVFSREIKIENCSLRLKRSIKKPNFRKFWCFFKLFRTLNEHLPCLVKKFWAGVSNLKILLNVFRVSIWGQK